MPVYRLESRAAAVLCDFVVAIHDFVVAIHGMSLRRGSLNRAANAVGIL